MRKTRKNSISRKKVPRRGKKMRRRSYDRLRRDHANRPGSADRFSGGGRDSKTKFWCPPAGRTPWGKPELAIVCEPCGLAMPVAETQRLLPDDTRESHGTRFS